MKEYNKISRFFRRKGKKAIYILLLILLINDIILQVRINNITNNNINDIQNLRILSLEGESRNKFPILHFSIDDVIEIFRDLTEHANTYNSIFDNNTLSYLEDLHEKYGMKVTLYCFYEFAGFSLSECTDKFSNEFLDNRDWLKFGFHAYDAESYTDTDAAHMRENYKLMARELHRITGFEEEDLSKVLRLDRFTGTRQQVTMLEQEFGVKTFLTADDKDRQSYCLDNNESNLLYEQDYYADGELFFTVTDIRIESLEDLNDLNNSLNSHKDEKYLVIFTHEWKLDNKIKKMINEIGTYGVTKQYTFSNDIF